MTTQRLVGLGLSGRVRGELGSARRIATGRGAARARRRAEAYRRLGGGSGTHSRGARAQARRGTPPHQSKHPKAPLAPLNIDHFFSPLNPQPFLPPQPPLTTAMTTPASASSPLPQALRDIHARVPEALRQPKVGIVCGSGLGGLGDVIQDRVDVPYHEIDGFGESTGKSDARKALGPVRPPLPLLPFPGPAGPAAPARSAASARCAPGRWTEIRTVSLFGNGVWGFSAGPQVIARVRFPGQEPGPGRVPARVCAACLGGAASPVPG